MVLFGVDVGGGFSWFYNDVLAFPASMLFLGSAIILTLKTRFIQIRGLPRFIRMITRETRTQDSVEIDTEPKKETISPLRALFAALATSIGMGNVVGPTLAIKQGGPGALFWLVVYMCFASVTKFTEVCFAMHTRKKMPDGYIVGGPMEYLRKVSPLLAYWYGGVMAVLFAFWSGGQANTLAGIFAIESVPGWLVGASLATLVFIIVQGGAKRVSALASRLVPVMFFLYVSFAFMMLAQNPYALYRAITQIFEKAFTPTAAIGGFLGATMFTALRYGVHRAIYISEAGTGTSSIPHAMSDAKCPSDQGLLAMGSTVADISLSIVSGLLVLVTGVWIEGDLRATLIYEAFKEYAPFAGQMVLLVSITLFVLTTVVGNSFNGLQSFSSLTRHRWASFYLVIIVCVILCGVFVPVSLVWDILDTLLVCAAIPNLIGVLYLAFKYPEVLELREDKSVQ